MYKLMESFPSRESSPKLSYTSLLHIYVVYTHTLYTSLLCIFYTHVIYTYTFFLCMYPTQPKKLSERVIIDSLSKLSLRFAEGFLFLGFGKLLFVTIFSCLVTFSNVSLQICVALYQHAVFHRAARSGALKSSAEDNAAMW